MNIENTSIQEIKKITEAQRAFFRSGETLSLKYRQRALCALSKALKQWEPRIAEALWEDLHKSYEEAYLTELSIVLGELDNHLRHLKHWVMPRRVRTPLKRMPPPAVAQSVSGRHLGWMYGGAEAFAIRASHLEGAGGNDQGDVPSRIHRRGAG